MAIGAIWKRGPHSFYVKVNSNVEKYIALENTQKANAYCKCQNPRPNRRLCPKCSQPDYFIHVYQSHTGAAPESCFTINSPDGQKTEIFQQKIGADDVLRGIGGDSVSAAAGTSLSSGDAAREKGEAYKRTTSDFSMGGEIKQVSQEDSENKEKT